MNFHDARVIPNVCFLLKWSGKALLFFSLTSFAANSRVSRVEPPNWWVGHTHNPVRLLISGENLTNGHLVVAAPFKLGPATVSENCRWLFVDLTIPASASPGEVALGFVSDKNVEQKVPFKLLPRLGPEQKASGMSSDDVVYLVMTDRFANGDASNDNPAGSPGLCDRRKLRRYHGGDFQGVLDHLDYLQELGVTTLWLTPWYDNANQLNFIQQFSPDYTNSAQREPSADYHGYGVTDFYAVEEHFGTMELLQKLVRQAHVLGMKVMQDQIVNLTSPYHPWLTNSPTPTWYNGTVKHHLANNFQTWTVTASNPPPDQLRATLDGWFFGILPDLNQNDPEVATYLIQNSLWWLGMTGADVVRQDALPYVPRNYWARWSQELKREFPRLTVLGEMWDGLPRRVAFFQGGTRRFDGIDSGVDALFDFPLYYAMHDVFLAGKPMSRLGEVLAADREYVNASALVTFLGLHDLGRFRGEQGATIEGLKLAFTFLLSTRGAPLIYYGDEVGLPGGTDPDNRREFPGGWVGDRHDAFTPAGRSAEEENVYAHVKKLLALRKQIEPLRKGKTVKLMAGTDACAFARVTRDNFAVTVCNNAGRRQLLEIPLAGIGQPNIPALTDRLTGLGTVRISQNKLILMVAPRSAAILTP